MAWNGERDYPVVFCGTFRQWPKKDETTMSGRCDYCGEIGDMACGNCLAPDRSDDLTKQLAEAQAEIERLTIEVARRARRQSDLGAECGGLYLKNERLIAEIENWREANRVTLADECASDEHHCAYHCACVMFLRAEIERLKRVHDAAWELETKWFNKVTALTARLAEAEGLLQRVVDHDITSVEIRAFLANQTEENAEEPCSPVADERSAVTDSAAPASEQKEQPSAGHTGSKGLPGAGALVEITIGLQTVHMPPGKYRVVDGELRKIERTSGGVG